MKTKYQPKAGDVCEWTSDVSGATVQVLVVSDSDEFGYVLTVDVLAIEECDCTCCNDNPNDLKLIYRP